MGASAAAPTGPKATPRGDGSGAVASTGATSTRGAELNRRLIEDGYCHVPGVVPGDLIERVRAFADAAADGLSAEEQERHRFAGSMIEVKRHEEMLPLIVLPAARTVLAGMGYPGARFYSGFIISKPPQVAPPLFWHQDGILWDDPTSYTDEPVQVFLMYYLVDTSRDNGCLRVIPGSHRRRHRLHALPPAHGDAINAAGERHPSLQPDPDEVDIPVRAGDLVIGDARLLHSAHPNRSPRRRTVITLWFLPTFPDLPEHLRAFYGKRNSELTASSLEWSESGWDELCGVLARYDGPLERPERSQIPDQRLT